MCFGFFESFSIFSLSHLLCTVSVCGSDSLSLPQMRLNRYSFFNVVPLFSTSSFSSWNSFSVTLTGVWSVSYTHLDVYKRQIEYCKLGAVTQRKLIENAADIIADGSLTQKQFVCNLTVSFSNSDKSNNILLLFSDVVAAVMSDR